MESCDDLLKNIGPLDFENLNLDDFSESIDRRRKFEDMEVDSELKNKVENPFKKQDESTYEFKAKRTKEQDQITYFCIDH